MVLVCLILLAIILSFIFLYLRDIIHLNGLLKKNNSILEGFVLKHGFYSRLIGKYKGCVVAIGLSPEKNDKELILEVFLPEFNSESLQLKVDNQLYYRMSPDKNGVWVGAKFNLKRNEKFDLVYFDQILARIE